MYLEFYALQMLISHLICDISFENRYYNLLSLSSMPCEESLKYIIQNIFCKNVFIEHLMLFSLLILMARQK